MVDADVIAARLADLADRLARGRQHLEATAGERAADRDALDLVSFNRMLACAHAASTAGWADLEAFAQQVAACTATRTR